MSLREVPRCRYPLLLLLLSLVIGSEAVEFWRYPALRRNRPTNTVPYIRPIRRHVVSFLPGHRGSVTLVYKSEVAVDVRWFRKATNVPNAEIENMLVTDGDPDYEMTSVSSGDVRATTLTWFNVNNDFPQKFVTCFSVNNTLFQYQVDTTIPEATRTTQTALVSHMYWVEIPSDVEIFHYNGNLQLTCAAVFAPESTTSRHLEELQMYTTEISLENGNRNGQAISRNLQTVHRSDNPRAESTFGEYTYLSEVTRLPFGCARYQVHVTVANATSEDTGLYTCALSRQHDRTYVSSWVRKGRARDKRPRIELLPCAPHDPQRRGRNIYMREGEPTCFNCRAYGYPRPTVYVAKGNVPVEESTYVHVDEHVNVPDGGLIEVTYTFWSPSSQDAGSYRCSAQIGNHQELSVPFNVVIRN